MDDHRLVIHQVFVLIHRTNITTHGEILQSAVPPKLCACLVDLLRGTPSLECDALHALVPCHGAGDIDVFTRRRAAGVAIIARNLSKTDP